MQTRLANPLRKFSALPQPTRLEIIAVIGIGLIAIFFRFYDLGNVPPGLNSDEATNFLHMSGLLRGEFRISFGPDAREPLFFYLSLVPVALLGFPFYAMRITAAIIGVATVLLIYLFARYWFYSRLLAAVAAFLATISVWHFFWSRYGLRAVLSVLVILLALWWYWRAIRYDRRRDFALAGICTGLALYTYLSARLLPLALILFTLVGIVLYRERIWDYLKGLVLTGFIAAILFVPLVLFYVTNVQDFISHSANLSILDPRVNKGDLWLALWNHIVAVVGMFLVRGDHEAYRNVPNRPVFDPIIGTFFVIGLIVVLFNVFAPRSSKPDRLRAAFVGIWLVVLISPSILSDDPPSYVRALAAMPAAMLIAAWGILFVWNFLQITGAHRLASVALGVLLFAETGFTFRDYFIDYAPSGVAFYAFDGHIIETGNWINRNAATSQIFIAPLWAQWPTMKFITRNTPTKSFESRDAIILPGRATGQDALIVFPYEQEKKADKLGERLGALGTRETLPGTFGVDYAIAYRIPANNLPEMSNPLVVLSRGSEFVQPQKIERTVWGDVFELLGYSIGATDPAKRNLEVTLFFHALKPMTEEYTFSIKVRDVKDRVWGQEDKWLGDNSYATTQWSPGDVIIEKFYPGLSACAPAGEYRLSVEVYNPKTMQVFGGVVALGTTRAETSPGNLYEHLEPEQALDVQVAPQARLLGYTLTPDNVQMSESFSLSLFWRGAGDGKQSPRVIVKLRDASKRDFILADQNIALPVEARGLCMFFDFIAPQDASAGAGSILVNDTKISTIQITR